MSAGATASRHRALRALRAAHPTGPRAGAVGPTDELRHEPAAHGALVRRVAAALSAGLVLLAASWAVVSLWWPPGFDHGLYVWTADTVLRGGMVYRDAWDMHGPLVAYLYAVPQALVGQRFWGVRALDLLLWGAGLAALARVVAHAAPLAPRPVGASVSPRALGWGAAATLLLIHAAHESEYTAQPDGWTAMATALVLAATALAPRPTDRHVALTGVVAGLLALVKPFYGVLVFVPLVHLAVDAGRAGWRRSVRAVALAALASAVPIAVIVAWFAARGALDALIEVHLQYTARSYSGSGLALGERMAGIVAFVRSPRVVVVPALLGAAALGGATLWRAGRRPLAAALGAWVALALFCVLLQNKYYGYHWVPVYPPLVVLAALGLGGALARRRPPAQRALAALALAAICALPALSAARAVARWALYVTGQRSHDLYYGAFTDKSPSRPDERMAAGRYVRDHAPAGASVLVWGSDPGVLYYAERPGATRLGAWSWPVYQRVGSPTQAAYAAEYLGALRERTPEYFVTNRRLNPRSWRPLHRHVAIARAVSERFVRDTTIGPYEIWRRRDVRRAGG